jgi:hypothetical protein
MDKDLPHIVEETKRIARIDAIISLLNTEIEVGIERAEVRVAKIEKSELQSIGGGGVAQMGFANSNK